MKSLKTKPPRRWNNPHGIQSLTVIAVLYVARAAPAAAQMYVLQDVLDYRTVRVLAPSGEEETVRLIGIEVREPGLEAKTEGYLRAILRGHDHLQLEFDRQQRDTDGYYLAYVWSVHRRDARWLAVNRINMHFGRDGLQEYWGTDDDDGLQYRCLNAELIRSGFARAAVIPPNVRYQKQLNALTREAQERRLQEIEATQESGIPRDLGECYLALKLKLSQPDLLEFMNTPEDELARYHLGLGMWMRNKWGLWRESALQRYFRELGINHPDDMSGIILTSFHRHLNQKEILLQEQIRMYQEYWARQEADQRD